MIFRARSRSEGLTLIELLIALFVVSSVMTGIFGLFILNMRLASEAERRIVGLALANERMDMVRNLPYLQVGTVGGVPAGDILQSEVVVRNNITYTVDTDIRYVDDPFDGLAGDGDGCIYVSHRPPGNPNICHDFECKNPAAANAMLNQPGETKIGERCDGTPVEGPDMFPNDYKQVRVEVSWESVVAGKSVVLVTHVAPKGIEGGELSGTLVFQALDAAGEGVVGALVRIVNSEVEPEVDITTSTNEDGRVILPGLPESSDSYELSVAKSGFTGEQTYDTLTDFVPHPEYSHFSAVPGGVTSRTFFIDQIAGVTIRTRDEEGENIGNVAFRLHGTKTIGVDSDEELVYRVDVEETTNAEGNHTINGVVWDDYDLIINGEVTGYDIKQISRVLPLTVDPGDEIEVIVTLVPYQESSLYVTVVDEQGDPVDGAEVRLAGGGYDEVLTTNIGQVYFPGDPDELQLTNGDFDLTVTADGFETYEVPVEVVDTTRLLIQLNSS